MSAPAAAWEAFQQAEDPIERALRPASTQLDQRLVDAEAIASMLGIGKKLVYDLRKSDVDPLPSICLGRLVRFDPERVWAWVAERSAVR